MSVPGPPGELWALSLLLWALAAAVVGEAVRSSAERWVTLWRAPEPVERFLVDFYLGGAVMYLVAGVEVGAFTVPVVFGLPIAAGALVVVRTALARHTDASPTPTSKARSERRVDRWALLAIASALGLYLVEVAVSVPVGTGNTYDSSLLTTYVALLLQHGSLPLSFGPYGTPALLYPQGTTVWLAWAQLDFGLPPARTALLVTPLFLGLAPLGGYVLGRRWVGTTRAGAAFALVLAWLGPSTRALVGGSNDFALAFPLVLVLAGQATVWTAPTPPKLADAVGFGALLGYGAVLNVIGAEWLFPALIVLGAIARPAFGGRARAWLGRWSAALATSAVAGIPSLYVLGLARTNPGSLAGAISAPATTPVGVGTAQLIGSVDPFLFRGGDVELSPIPLVRLELALLIVLGAAVLLWMDADRRTPSRWTAFSRWGFAAGTALLGWFGLLFAASEPGSSLRVLAFISNGREFSVWLFTVYGLIAAVPLGLALDRLAGRDDTPRTPREPPRSPPSSPFRRFVPAAFAIVVIVPAVVLTPTSLGSVLSGTYADFGNVSGADFQLLEYAGAHFGPGTRVLVAPGSAAEFLPGYARDIVVVYPMVPGWSRQNASYSLVVRELTNGTLTASGLAALASLDLDYVAVTGNNTVLWPAFWAAPLQDARSGSTPTFPVVFHDADAWIFNASGCRPASLGCP